MEPSPELPGTPDAPASLSRKASSRSKLKPLPRLPEQQLPHLSDISLPPGRQMGIIDRNLNDSSLPSSPSLPSAPARSSVPEGRFRSPTVTFAMDIHRGPAHKGDDMVGSGPDLEAGVRKVAEEEKENKSAAQKGEEEQDIQKILCRSKRLSGVKQTCSMRGVACLCMVVTVLATVCIAFLVIGGPGAEPLCSLTHESGIGVSMAVNLPFDDKATFSGERQALFVRSVAQTSNVDECAVKITSISEMASRRRLLSPGGINVAFEVRTATVSDAKRVAGKLDEVSLNMRLLEHGLPAATTLQEPTVFGAEPNPSALCPAGYTGESCIPCAAGTYKEETGRASCSPCPQGHNSPPASTQLSSCTQPGPAQTAPCISMDRLREHASAESCWVLIHAKVIDVTSFRDKHPGGRDRLACGSDLTEKFQNQHGMVSSLISRLDLPAFASDLKLLGDMCSMAAETSPPSPSAVPSKEFDFSTVVKKPHPGSGAEFKSLVYIELKGAWDSASGFISVKDQEEVHLWCSKRPSLSADEYCDCTSSNAGACENYVLKMGSDARVFPLNNTGGLLAMTDLLASGNTGWLSLWKDGKMSLVPGVGRFDHARSHFEVKDAAAKGVSVEEEKHTSNGWLAKSIFGYNNLFCSAAETSAGNCPPAPGVQPTMVDAISLAQAAAGPNALEMSDTVASIDLAQGLAVSHITGVKSVDEVLESSGANYINPFMIPRGGGNIRRVGGQTINAKDYRDDDAAQQSVRQTEEELWAATLVNPGLEDLLVKEATIFRGLGILQERLDGYIDNLPILCPVSEGNTGFPDIFEWADSESDAEIGMQLRAVAILLVNGVVPKVFQLQQTKYDTHSNQRRRLKTLLSDLKTGIFTFVKAAENCGFWDDVLVTTFTDFGRRFEENSRAGTDHGWSSTNMVFGKNLRRRVFGFNHISNSSALRDIVPLHADAYDPSKSTKGDLTMTTDLETWNACLLNALALPALPRLSRCPQELQLRDNLATIPMFDETLYHATTSVPTSAPPAGVTSQSPAASASMTGDGDRSHLTRVLSRSEVLHFARRVGFSAKSLGLEQYLIPSSLNSTGLPTISLQQAISLALAPSNINAELPSPKVYVDYVPRRHNPIKLWSQERREKRNNWEDVMSIPYPRHDPIERRLKRWGLEKFFNLSSIVDVYPGYIQVHPEYAGREEQILHHLRANATLFFLPKPASWETNKPDKNLLDRDLRIKDVSKVNWFATIMSAPNVAELLNLSFAQLVEDWKCDNATRTHPNDITTPCDPGCDLRNLLTIDYEAQTAMLTDVSAKGPDGTRATSKWKTLQQCMVTSSARKQYEVERYNQIKGEVKLDIMRQYFLDFTNPKFGLRARMAWFFLNWFATPSTAVNDWLLMYKHYYTVWTGALGNFRTLARKMFVDAALRKSLDQFEEVECGTAPIENFSREWFERFTVGNRAHNEGDIKRLAKGLMNCRDDSETSNADLMSPGMIFTNVTEILWTVTESEQHDIVDRILDYKKTDGEPPAASQFLCAKLYTEFARLPEEPTTMSSLGFSAEVVSCARHLIDHNYDVTFALEHIFQDKGNFRDVLGTKKRWPLATIIEPMIDYDIFSARSFANPETWAPTWATKVGMTPFEPQDVSGFDLDTVWTLDRLAKAHEFREDIVQWIAYDSFDTTDFESPESMMAKLAPYNLAPASPDHYAYSVRLCGPDLFVDAVGMKGNQTIDSTTFFEHCTNKASRLKAWKDAMLYALVNVCQFVT